MKVATFTVRADVRQSARWKQAAEAEGFPSVGAWAAQALDAYLKTRARAGNPLPLAWRRGRFSVRLEGGELVQVSGHVSPPFGSFSGTEEGPAAYPGRHRHPLVYLPDARIIATLRTFRQCKALAAELAPVLLRGELPEPAPIIERHARQSFERASRERPYKPAPGGTSLAFSDVRPESRHTRREARRNP